MVGWSGWVGRTLSSSQHTSLLPCHPVPDLAASPVSPYDTEMLQRLMDKMEAAESMQKKILESSEKNEVRYI